MPGDTGVEFLVELYRDPYTATCRKVLLTGQAGLEAMVRAVNFAKLDYYIGKPWNQDELVAVVRKLLGEYIRDHAPDPEVVPGLPFRTMTYTLLEGEHAANHPAIAALRAAINEGLPVGTVHRYRYGDLLIREGDLNDALLVILEGRVLLLKGYGTRY